MESQISSSLVNYFRRGIYKWKKQFGLRNFPWRNTDNKYEIFIAEFLLRRTQSIMVANFWDEFFGRFPNFDSIREVKEEELEKVLVPLGLSKIRARSLKKLVTEFEGEDLPKTEKDLANLHGVGTYISRMYLQMTSTKRRLVWDSNFIRVYSRFFGVSLNTNKAGIETIEDISSRIIPSRNSKEFILTVLDFSAATCRPQSPLCLECALRNKCKFYQKRD